MRRRCSIRLVALLGSPALLVVALGYLTHSSDAGQAGATKAALIAATSYSQDDAGHKNPIVRVRWSLVDGWLPAGGFNVYRDNDVKPLNSAPLIAQTSPLPEAGDRISGRKSPAEFHKTYARVLALASNKAHYPEKEISPFTGHPHQRAASSEDVFKAMQQHREQVLAFHQGLPRWHEQNTVVQLRQPTLVAEYQSWLREEPTVTPLNKGPKATALPKRAPPSEVEQVRHSRTQIIMASSLYPAVASHLGLAFDDRNVAAGRSTLTTSALSLATGREARPRRRWRSATSPSATTPTLSLPRRLSAISPVTTRSTFAGRGPHRSGRGHWAA